MAADEKKHTKPPKSEKPEETSIEQAEELDGSSVNVKIYSPFKVYYNGPAKSISAENDTGPFDILPKHHNFMTLLNAGEISVSKGSGGDQKYRIARGVMHVKKNQVIVFLDV
jgi:F0F1-type ATP synthase epsilon subunit